MNLPTPGPPAIHRFLFQTLKRRCDGVQRRIIMQVNFDLARLSDYDIQQFLGSFGGESPFSNTISEALSREKQRRLSGGDPVWLVLPPIADGVSKKLVVNLLTAVVSIGEEMARCSDQKTKEELETEGGFISALIVALSLQAEEVHWPDC